jgi:hypothetical protein
MPRSLVDDNRSVACSVGLHVGSFHFANGFYGGGKLLVVKINPRDVVSVPADAGDQKIRVHRYVIVSDNPDRSALTGTSYVSPGVTDEDDEVLDDGYDEYDDDDECTCCGYDVYDCTCDESCTTS